MIQREKSVLLIHGWPGTSDDFHLVRKALPKNIKIVAPDLTGFGDSFVGNVPIEQATAESHAALLLRQIESHELKLPIITGYDIGSRVAQSIAHLAPERIGGLVITPGYPGIGNRVSHPDIQAHFWYQHFHRLDLASDVLDGNRPAIAAYIRHFLSNWSYNSDIVSDDRFEKLIDFYARTDAFRASIAWYKANRGYSGSNKIAVRTTMLWPENDPLFPVEWADKISEFFTDAKLTIIQNCGHFVPLEAPAIFANAILNHFDNDSE